LVHREKVASAIIITVKIWSTAKISIVVTIIESFPNSHLGTLLFSSSSNGLPFENVAHEEFRWPQSVAHFA
jgi:hypothetical protein